MPGAQQTMRATFTPTAIGQAEALAACFTADPCPPVGFSTVAQVRGLAVTYTIQPAPADTPPQNVPQLLQSTTAGFPTDAAVTAAEAASIISNRGGSKEVLADFGSCNIGQSRSLLLLVHNPTPLAASVSLWLETFQADLPSTTTGYAANASISTAAFAPSIAAIPSAFSPLPTLGQLLPNSTVQASLSLLGSSFDAAVESTVVSGLAASHMVSQLRSHMGSQLQSHMGSQLQSQLLTNDEAAFKTSRGRVPGRTATHKRKHSLVRCLATLFLDSRFLITC